MTTTEKSQVHKMIAILRTISVVKIEMNCKCGLEGEKKKKTAEGG